MKILVVRASPRKDGVSRMVGDKFTAALSAANADFTDIDLSAKNIGACRGCYACTRTGECVLKDDMAEILKLVDSADVLVCITPVYFYSMSALLKNFFERCFPFVKGYYLDSEKNCLRNETGFFVKDKKFLTISVASGRLSSFEALSKTFSVIAGSLGFEYVADVRRGESAYFELAANSSLRIKNILDCFATLATELVQNGKISAETLSLAERQISESDEAFSKHTSVFWELKKSGRLSNFSRAKKI